jgi:hypothetical protein
MRKTAGVPEYMTDDERRAAKAARERERRRLKRGHESARERAERLQSQKAKRDKAKGTRQEEDQPRQKQHQEKEPHRPPGESYPLWAIDHEPTEAEMRAVMSTEVHLLNDGSIGLCDRRLCPCRRIAAGRESQAQARQARVDRKIREIEGAAA